MFLIVLIVALKITEPKIILNLIFFINYLLVAGRGFEGVQLLLVVDIDSRVEYLTLNSWVTVGIGTHSKAELMAGAYTGQITKKKNFMVSPSILSDYFENS